MLSVLGLTLECGSEGVEDKSRSFSDVPEILYLENRPQDLG